MTKTIIKTITALLILTSISFAQNEHNEQKCEGGDALSGEVTIVDTTDGKAILCGIAFVSGKTYNVANLSTEQSRAIAHGLFFHQEFFSNVSDVTVVADGDK